MMEKPVEIDSMTSNELRKQKIAIKRRMIGISLGYMFVLSGYSALMSLQTTINLSNGVGANSMTIIYSIGIIGCFLAPAFFTLFGLKPVLITVNFFYVLDIIANLYPEYLLLPFATLLGFGMSVLWVSACVVYVHFAKQYKKFSKQDYPECIAQFAALCMPILMQSHVVGNAVAAVVLKMLFVYGGMGGGFPPMPPPGNATFGNSSEFLPPMFDPELRYSRCAANDCQDKNATQAFMALYKPERTVLVCLVLSLAFISFLGCIITMFLIPSISMKNLHSDESEACLSADIGGAHGLGKTIEVDGNLDFSHRLRKTIHETVLAIKNTFLHLGDIKLLLCIIPNIYWGVSDGFFIADFTRSFIACSYGFTMISSAVTLYFVSFSLANFLSGKFTLKYMSRWVVWAGAFTTDLIYMLIVLFWRPSAESAFVIYIMVIMAGLAQGQTNIIYTASFPVYFPQAQDIAFTYLNIWWCIGFVTHVTLNQAITCIKTKIYYVFVLMGLCYTLLAILLKKFKI